MSWNPDSLLTRSILHIHTHTVSYCTRSIYQILPVLCAVFGGSAGARDLETLASISDSSESLSELIWLSRQHRQLTIIATGCSTPWQPLESLEFLSLLWLLWLLWPLKHHCCFAHHCLNVSRLPLQTVALCSNMYPRFCRQCCMVLWMDVSSYEFKGRRMCKVFCKMYQNVLCHLTPHDSIVSHSYTFSCCNSSCHDQAMLLADLHPVSSICHQLVLTGPRLRCCELRPFDADALWTAVTAGEPLPMELCHRVQSSSLTTLRNHYGQTEARLNQLPLAGRDLFWFGMWLRRNVRKKYLEAVWD